MRLSLEHIGHWSTRVLSEIVLIVPRGSFREFSQRKEDLSLISDTVTGGNGVFAR